MWKDYYYFPRKERRGILILTILIVTGIIISFILPENETGDINPDADEIDREYAEFLSSLKEVKGKSDTYANINEKHTYELEAFDPNTVDSVTLVKMGLAKWIAGNVVKYRDKGGKFYKTEDFRKIYGLTDEKYRELIPYIHIEKVNEPMPAEIYIAKKQDTIYNEKYPAGTTIELNTADTTELKKIPGIGSGIAGMIVSFRNRLGGFYSLNQLNEINLKTDELDKWFSVNPVHIEKINLNRVNVDRLRSHPYFNFYQAKAIVEHRKKKGPLVSLDQFSLYEEFSVDDFQRMIHYICFE